MNRTCRPLASAWLFIPTVAFAGDWIVYGDRQLFLEVLGGLQPDCATKGEDTVCTIAVADESGSGAVIVATQSRDGFALQFSPFAAVGWPETTRVYRELAQFLQFGNDNMETLFATPSQIIIYCDYLKKDPATPRSECEAEALLDDPDRTTVQVIYSEHDPLPALGATGLSISWHRTGG